MERLDKGLIDFGLLVGQTDISRYDHIRLPKKDIWGVLMPKGCLLAEKETVVAEDLRHKPLIISHQTSMNSEMSAWLQSDISRLNIVATYDLVYNAAQFVKKGLGYVISLDRLINTTGDSNLCFRPLFPAVEAELCIVWKKVSGAFTGFKSVFETAAGGVGYRQVRRWFKKSNQFCITSFAPD